jgi:uracil phosphoribosyltransferase
MQSITKQAKRIVFISLSSFLLYKSYIYQKTSLCLGRDKNIKLDAQVPNYFEIANYQHLRNTYPNLILIESRAIDNLMGILRDKDLKTPEFRVISRRLIRILLEEALAYECDVEIVKQSPLGNYKTIHNPRDTSNYIAISILRSGNTMIDDLIQILPDIDVGNILVQRNENHESKEAVFFFEKLPKDIKEKRILLVDPMLATGGSGALCIQKLLEKGVKEENIVFINIISCEEGIANVFRKYPKIKLISARCDPFLLPNKYIAPGLGDFGDRFYGTQH